MSALEKFLEIHPFPWKRSKTHKDQVVDAKGRFVADDMYLAAAIVEYEAHRVLKVRVEHAVEQFQRDIDRDNPEY